MIRLLPALLLSACTAPPPTPAADLDGVHALVDELYASFDFEGDREPDWAAMEALFLPGAQFVPPIPAGAPARVQDAGAFLASFAGWVRTGEFAASGLHERVLAVRAEAWGQVAHAWVAFEGVDPASGQVQTRGVDSLQLVRHGGQWRLASFTSQYAAPGEPLPARFLRP